MSKDIKLLKEHFIELGTKLTDIMKYKEIKEPKESIEFLQNNYQKYRTKKYHEKIDNKKENKK